MKKLAVGCENIDEALRGGLEPSIITEIYGEGGTGKTTFCMQLAKNCVLNDLGKVIFIDTESASIERLTQVCGDDFDKVSREILFFEANTMDEQEEYVEKSIRMVLDGDIKIGLIIIDSISVFYRLSLGSDQDMSGRRSLSEQVIKLMALARKKGIFITFTSQVYTDIENNEFLPLGGHVLSHNAKTIIKLSRHKGNLRNFRLMKHRSIGELGPVYFRLVNSGLVPEEPPENGKNDKKKYELE